MRKATFSLVVDRIGGEFAYKCGFKAKSDADEYVKHFGGVVETIDCAFYDSFADAKAHQTQVQDAITLISKIRTDESLRALVLADETIMSELRGLVQ